MKKLLLLFICLCLLAGCQGKPQGNDKPDDPAPPVDDPYVNDNGDDGDDDAPDPVNYSVTIWSVEQEVASATGTAAEKVELTEALVSFSRIPFNLDDLLSVDRDDDEWGKFYAVALLICAYKTWTPNDEDTCMEMMKALMNSPSSPDTYTNYTKSFVKERMLQNDKGDYIADCYFYGATPANGYVWEEPPGVMMREYPYAPELSTINGVELYVEKIVVEFEGADTERTVSVYQDPTDHNWYIFSDTYGHLLVDVMEPERYK